VIERTFHTPRALTLDLAVPVGTIEVETSDGEETHVVLDGDDKDLENARLELVTHSGGDTLVVDVGRKRLLGVEIAISSLAVGRTRYRLRVRCPHGAAAEIRTASADVALAGRLRSLALNTVSGDAVVAAEIEQDANVKSVSGDVRLRGVGGGLRANTVSGDLEAGDVNGPLEVRSMSGDVEVASVREGEAKLQSVSGDLRVGIRNGSRVDVDASSVSGDLRSELELTEVPTGGDGPVVVLRGKTVSGDFRVVRA
jgi:hypothetical protein